MEECKTECITVSIRIKPNLTSNNVSSLQLLSKDPPILAIEDKSQVYHFDHIFTDEVSQEQIYNETVKPLVDYVKKGFSATVFAYGQTGTGKTYTMGTASETFVDKSYNGIIPRALEQIFREDSCNNSKDVLISFLEIYNEKVFDLLQPTRKSSLPVSGFMVQNMVLQQVEDVNTAMVLLELGNKNRHIAETKQNISSSRSHAIFTVHFTLRNSTDMITGKLNLVDLAGSESVKKTGNIGSTFYEGVNINKGLLSIGQVISALSMKSAYIPYRQSTITSILQGSLNTENYISLIACVSSSAEDITETLQTLDFSQRVKKICSNPEVNQIITKYRREYTNQTPLKRLNASLLKTTHKRTAMNYKPLVFKNQQNQCTSQKNSTCQSSLYPISNSVTNNSNTTQEMLSPVIRRHVKEMEESIIAKLQTIIQNTIEKPVKKNIQENMENTPCVPWNKIENDVLKLVRSEIKQLTVRATSSPIEYNEAAKVKRVLNYNSPENINSGSELSEKIEQNDFKVPEILALKKKNQRKSVLNKNEENEIIKHKPRRSMRLAKNKMDKTLGDDFESVNNSNISTVNMNSISRNTKSMKVPFKENILDESIHCQRNNILCSTVKKAKPCNINKKNKLQNVKTTKKNLANESYVEDAHTCYLNKVLNILNYGNLNELESLQSVGPKTAKQIMLYRQLRGNFNEVNDISKIPGWGEKKFEKFMIGNMLK